MEKTLNINPESERHIDVEDGTVDTAVDIASKDHHEKEHIDHSETSPERKSPFLVYYTTFGRFAVASFLTAAGCHAIPKVYLDTPTQDFKYCSIFFILATGFLLINSIIDFSLATGRVAKMNSFLHVLAAAILESGSISLYPGLDKSGEPLAQYFFLAGTLVVCFAVFWDIGRLLHRGQAVSTSVIIALFSAIVGAVNFNYGTAFLMPEYQTSDRAIEKGGTFFVAGGACFFVNAFAMLKENLF